MAHRIPKGKYDDCLYRVSLKMVIRNTQGEVLLVKEKGSNWTLPGGGLDYGETLEAGMLRELREEVAASQLPKYKYLGIDSIFVARKQHWQMWLVYETNVDESFEYGIGEDADEVAFIDPKIFRTDHDRLAQLIYKWCVARDHKVTRY